LAAVLEENGHAPRVIDLNRWYYEYLRSEERSREGADFCAFAVERLKTEPSQLYGLSTICSCYPVTLRIAEGIKRVRPGCTIVLGGPQASAVDAATIEAFSFVDFVVRGEADDAFPQLLSALAGAGSPEGVPGLTYRRAGKAVRNASAPAIADLDRLPLPAFHLYPDLKHCRFVPLELGRGCPFGCTFCSTNEFFSRRFRLKSPARMIEQMRHVKRTYGIGTFNLVHDMFTVDRKRLAAFCQALLESGETFCWNCSARTDCIDEELIALMARAGCRGMFFGIETGSPRMQRLIRKNLDLGEAMRTIERSDAHQMKTAVSLITGFPEETLDDFRQSVAFLADSLRFGRAEPQLHLLAPLAGTPLHRQYRDRLVFDRIVSDMSHQGWRQAEADLEMIRAHPDIFPNFYAVPPPGLERTYLNEFREFFEPGAERFRWLLVALHQLTGDLLRVFDRWLVWRDANVDGAVSGDLRRYCASLAFCDDFLRFVDATFVEGSGGGAGVIRALLEYEASIRKLGEPPAEDSSAAEADEEGQALPGGAYPKAPPNVHVCHVSMDCQEILECLRRKDGLDRLGPQPTELAIRQSADKSVDVIRLSASSAQLLRLCDGSRTVDQICRSFGAFAEPVLDIPPDTVGRFGLEVLRVQGLIVASAGAAESVEDDSALAVVDRHAETR
jgi:radical SAM superfamily enzyme YgiQ (UPF0313 family)